MNSILATNWLRADDYFEDLAVFALGPIHPGGFEGTRDVFDALSWKHMRVLDIGCGTGFTASILRGVGAHVIGLEPSKTMREAAIKNGMAPENVLEGHLETAWNVSKGKGPYDVILLEGVAGFITDFPCKLRTLVKAFAVPSFVVVADWDVHERGDKAEPYYRIEIPAQTDPSELTQVLEQIGYTCSVKRSAAVAMRFDLSIEEALRRASILFPNLNVEQLVGAVSRKVTLMRNTWATKLEATRYVLVAQHSAASASANNIRNRD